MFLAGINVKEATSGYNYDLSVHGRASMNQGTCLELLLLSLCNLGAISVHRRQAAQITSPIITSTCEFIAAFCSNICPQPLSPLLPPRPLSCLTMHKPHQPHPPLLMPLLLRCSPLELQ
jgi:hypothetical protein